MAENKRTAAYENIFGRPSTQHHRPPSTSPSLVYSPSQVYRSPQLNGQYHYQSQPTYQQQYYPQQDTRGSYTPSVSSSLHTTSYPQQYPAPQAYAQPPYRNQLAPPQERPPARSVVSAQGVIVPQPEQPPDASLEALTRQGLTPAQAYQAQVYLNSPAGQQSNWNPYRAASPVPTPSTSHANVQSHYTEPDTSLPRIDGDDGVLSIEFEGDSSQEGSALPYVATLSKPASLQLNTAIAAPSAPSVSTVASPDSSTQIESSSTASPRRSSESSPMMPKPKGARQRTIQDRSKSMSATTSQAKTILNSTRNSQPPLPSPAPTTNSHSGGHRRTPIVYPALLSRVAEAFRIRVTTAERVKDGLTYKDAFDGREAVDKIAYIIKTTDRCLALLLGRALDAQKFFHDVTYDHRLRDNANELYQFRTRLASPFVSGEDVAAVSNGRPRPSLSGPRDSGNESSVIEDSSTLVDAPSQGHSVPPGAGNAVADEDELPSGVFTLLTDCYSPTCTRDRLCYSIACPRRLEQQSRLNLKQEPGLKRSISRESLGDFVEPGTLWVHSVPQEVVDSVSDTEKKRQEAINEVIYTERDFVRDMEYLRDIWMKPLQTSNIIPEERRQDFLSQVFWNINDIISVNVRLRDALNKRQKSYAVVEKIGDILLDAVPHFAPFVNYGSHQLYGKYEFEKEKNSNPAFAQFVEEAERLPESRKLELNGYLTKPTTRLARYPLLLEVVLKYTPDDSPDKAIIPQAIKIVREFLGKVNVESGKTENRFNLLQLDQQLIFRPGESVDLRLKEEGRELVYKGSLKKRGGSQSDSGDLQVFLFDHALLMVKQKSKHEQHKVHRRPIPLELLVVAAQDDTAVTRPSTSRGKNSLVKHNSLNRNVLTTAGSSALMKGGDSKNGYPITFVHLGRHAYQLTLWASTWVARKKWVENIQKQQERMRERSLIFDTFTLSESFFSGVNKVNCAAPFNGGRQVAYGTDDGVYFSDLREPNREPMKVVALMDVAQLDILDEYQLLIVLSDRAVITFPLDALDPRDPSAGLKRAKRVSAHTSFFKAGTCLGRTLVCVVKTSPLSSTIKALEPIDYNARGKNKPTFRKLLQGGNDTLRSFKEFYIPVESNSIHFLKTKLCVGCVKGFEIVDLETLDTQGLLDPDDVSLDFVQKREVVRPMAIYRIDADFLLCYDEFAFYVNRSGWRARPQFMVHWEGYPTAFALHYPYLLAFEPTFVEIRHVETGHLTQIIQGNNLRCLFADTPPSNPNLPHNPHNPYPSTQSPYGIPQQYGDRNSLYNQYGAPQYPANVGYGRGGYSAGRDEIIMVSDDSVVALRLAGPVDATSMVSR